VAIAAAHALKQYNLQRVAIADFDVHHGAGSGNDHIINVPLTAGSNGAIFRAAVTEYWLPALERFQPELLLISAGFDAHKEDEMGGLKLLEDDYVWVTEELMAIGERFAKSRIVSLLEGGYALQALARSVVAHIECLCEL
jgi:acetoin utilization deacetylase AcuC-like enzyme